MTTGIVLPSVLAGSSETEIATRVEKLPGYGETNRRDFECEGHAPYALFWAKHIECEYLRRFASGPHAKEVVDLIGVAAKGLADALRRAKG
jgi:hypothetical protein